MRAWKRSRKGQLSIKESRGGLISFLIYRLLVLVSLQQIPPQFTGERDEALRPRLHCDLPPEKRKNIECTDWRMMPSWATPLYLWAQGLIFSIIRDKKITISGILDRAMTTKRLLQSISRIPWYSNGIIQGSHFPSPCLSNFSICSNRLLSLQNGFIHPIDDIFLYILTFHVCSSLMY